MVVGEEGKGYMPDTIKNHIVPQFYLKHFINNIGKLACYDVILKKFDYKTTQSVPVLKRTYPQSLEFKFAQYENSFKLKYDYIIRELQNYKKEEIKLQTKALSKEDYDSLLKFITIQSFRTNKGRINLRQQYGHQLPNSIDLKNIRTEAEYANQILLEKDFETIYEETKLKDCEPIIVFLKTKQINLWTSSDPVVYTHIDSLLNPLDEILGNDKRDCYDCCYFPMTKNLAAVITNSTVDSPLINYNNMVIPIDGHNNYIISKEDSQQAARGLNFNLCKYIDFSDVNNLASNDFRTYKYYIITSRFQEDDKRYLQDIIIGNKKDGEDQ